MHGHVQEWCEDVWHGSYINAPTDCHAWLDGENSDRSKHILRGASWNTYAGLCRSAYREGASHIHYDIGFRVVRILE